MLYITFNVYKQKIKRTDTQQIVSDSRNYLHAAITFSDDDWTGIKTAVFKNGDVVKHAVLDDNNECLVPWEVIKPGILHEIRTASAISKSGVSNLENSCESNFTRFVV